MTKIHLAFAAALVIASASSTVAFAASQQPQWTQNDNDRTMALAPGYGHTDRDLSGGFARRSDYGDPWVGNSPMSDGRPQGS
jgi:hypothetical protein